MEALLEEKKYNFPIETTRDNSSAVSRSIKNQLSANKRIFEKHPDQVFDVSIIMHAHLHIPENI